MELGNCGRTEHGGEKDDAGEEDMSLHAESFMRKEILLNYLCDQPFISFCVLCG
jgi:hypothetical protein